MVMVYGVRIKDSSRAEMAVAQHKRTAEWIEKIGGGIVLGTGEEVDDSKIDGQGRCVPERGKA